MVRNEKDVLSVEVDLVNYYKDFSKRMRKYQGEELCDIVKEKNYFTTDGCKNDYNKMLPRGLREVMTIMIISMHKLYYDYFYDTINDTNHVVKTYLNDTETCTLSKLSC